MRRPRVSPDGKQVAFPFRRRQRSRRVDSRTCGIHVAAPAHLRRPESIPDLVFGRPVTSSFQSDREGDLGLFKQRADGSGAAERLTRAEDGAAHVAESWSPSSGHLLLTITRSSEVCADGHVNGR